MKGADGAGTRKAGADQGLRELLALRSVDRGFGKMFGDPSKKRVRERIGVHVYVVGIAVGDTHLDAHLGDAIVKWAIDPVDGGVDRDRDCAKQKKHGQACVD